MYIIHMMTGIRESKQQMMRKGLCLLAFETLPSRLLIQPLSNLHSVFEPWQHTKRSRLTPLPHKNVGIMP